MSVGYDDSEFAKTLAYLDALGDKVDKLTYWDERRQCYTEPPPMKFDLEKNGFVPEK